jgi:hypothetical protein
LIYLTIPERHLKQDDLDKIKDNLQCQKNFLNFLKRRCGILLPKIPDYTKSSA